MQTKTRYDAPRNRHSYSHPTRIDCKIGGWACDRMPEYWRLINRAEFLIWNLKHYRGPWVPERLERAALKAEARAALEVAKEIRRDNAGLIGYRAEFRVRA